MSAEVRERCLEPFFTTKGDNGTGLGLAMVFGIIQRHQGTLEIESEPGKGSTFRLRLPARAASPIEHDVDSAPATAPGTAEFNLPVGFQAAMLPVPASSA
jgi:hypothetical protein